MCYDNPYPIVPSDVRQDGPMNPQGQAPVNGGEVLIEDINGRIPIQESGYQYPLLLPYGQVGCVSTQKFVVKVREFHDFQELLIIDFLFQDDICFYREVAEDLDALGNDAHMIPESRGSRNDSVVEDCSGLRLQDIE